MKKTRWKVNIAENKNQCNSKQLNGTFHFMLILAVPVDKGGSVSSNVRLLVPAAKRLLRQEESGWQLRRRTFS